MLPSVYSQHVGLGHESALRAVGARRAFVNRVQRDVPLNNELVQHRPLQNQTEREMAIVDNIDWFYAASLCISRSAIGVRRSSGGRK